MNILECRDLTKRYKAGVNVLDKFSIDIPKGRIVGLLGPNGCGKSTLIKLISGLLQPNGGEIRVDGEPVGEKTRAMISYLPERTYFNSWMKVDEPIAGVDPAAREYILSTIVSNYDPEATIIITTHLISDVEQVLDDFIFLSQNGKIIAGGSVEQARAESGKSLDEYFREVFRK